MTPDRQAVFLRRCEVSASICVCRAASVAAMSNDETDILRELEKLVEGAEIWEIVRRYRIHRQRQSDDEYQTVEVEVMRNRGVGWLITAKDAHRNLSASGNPHRDLNVVLHTVHWGQLDKPALPPEPRS